MRGKKGTPFTNSTFHQIDNVFESVLVGKIRRSAAQVAGRWRKLARKDLKSAKVASLSHCEATVTL
jgi:hypothetical protein